MMRTLEEVVGAEVELRAVCERTQLDAGLIRMLGVATELERRGGEAQAADVREALGHPSQGPTYPRIVDMGRKIGAVTGRPDPTDGRRVILTLTDQGRRMLSEWRRRVAVAAPTEPAPVQPSVTAPVPVAAPRPSPATEASVSRYDELNPPPLGSIHDYGSAAEPEPEPETAQDVLAAFLSDPVTANEYEPLDDAALLAQSEREMREAEEDEDRVGVTPATPVKPVSPAEVDGWSVPRRPLPQRPPRRDDEQRHPGGLVKPVKYAGRPNPLIRPPGPRPVLELSPDFPLRTPAHLRARKQW